VVTPYVPSGSSEEVGTSAIGAAILGILADPEVIQQFGTAVAATSVPSMSGGFTDGTVDGTRAGAGELTGGLLILIIHFRCVL
jgi:uncharacterized protein YcfJ